MFNFPGASIEKLIVHYVGNKLKKELGFIKEMYKHHQCKVDLYNGIRLL